MAGSVPTGLNARGVVIGDSARGENPVGWAWSGGRTTMLRGTSKHTALPAAKLMYIEPDLYRAQPV